MLQFTADNKKAKKYNWNKNLIQKEEIYFLLREKQYKKVANNAIKVH